MKALPKRAVVIEKIQKLIADEGLREETSQWATSIVISDDYEVSDPEVWSVLTALMGADLIAPDRPYLYEKIDFEAWLGEIQET